jgi:hypothetical protein
MKAIQYYIIGYEDARRLGVTQYRIGTPRDGYVVHGGDFAGATDDFMERAVPVTREEALDFIKGLGI